jgi:hypothetical protein
MLHCDQSLSELTDFDFLDENEDDFFNDFLLLFFMSTFSTGLGF